MCRVTEDIEERIVWGSKRKGNATISVHTFDRPALGTHWFFFQSWAERELGGGGGRHRDDLQGSGPELSASQIFCSCYLISIVPRKEILN